MATSLGEVAIYIGLKGLEGTLGGLRRIKNVATGGLGNLVAQFENLSNVGRSLQGPLLMSAAAMGGFLAKADPKGVWMLQSSLTRLSVQIGSIFIPILDNVQIAIDRLLNWFRGLSNETKDNISSWVGYGMAAAAVLVVLPRISSAVGMVSTALRVMGMVLSAATGGLLPLIGMILGVGVAGAAVKNPLGFLDGIKPLLDGIMKLFGTFTGVIEAMAPLFDDMVSGVSAAIEALTPVFEAVFDGIGYIIKATGATAVYVGSLIADAMAGEIPDLDKAAARAKAVWNAQKKEREIGAKATGRHAGELKPNAPQLISLVDAWKKAQVAVIDPQLDELNRIREQQTEGNNIMRMIREYMKMVAERRAQGF